MLYIPKLIAQRYKLHQWHFQVFEAPWLAVNCQILSVLFQVQRLPSLQSLDTNYYCPILQSSVKTQFYLGSCIVEVGKYSASCNIPH